jgi:hypothetical protein
MAEISFTPGEVEDDDYDDDNVDEEEEDREKILKRKFSIQFNFDINLLLLRFLHFLLLRSQFSIYAMCCCYAHAIFPKLFVRRMKTLRAFYLVEWNE